MIAALLEIVVCVGLLFVFGRYVCFLQIRRVRTTSFSGWGQRLGQQALAVALFMVAGAAVLATVDTVGGPTHSHRVVPLGIEYQSYSSISITGETTSGSYRNLRIRTPHGEALIGERFERCKPFVRYRVGRVTGHIYVTSSRCVDDHDPE